MFFAFRRHDFKKWRAIALRRKKSTIIYKNNIMKKASIQKITFLLLVTLASVITAFSQTAYQSQVLDIKLSGTSNVHDWEMTAVKGKSEAAFTVDATGKLLSLSKLNFTLPVKNLKSSHTAMDKNTYKALNEEKNPNISFVLTYATVISKGGNNYQLNCSGQMSIAGTTKQTDLVATGQYNPTSKSFLVTGVKKMKMTDYNVKPPKALFGTIKTGDDISISYNLVFNK
jgi:polyisoprenoid-binding protein YceI